MASVPAERIFPHPGRAKIRARAKSRRTGVGARKPHDFEKPVRPRTGLPIGAVWSLRVTGLTSSYQIFAKIKMAEHVEDFETCLNEVISELSEAGLSFTLKTEQERAMQRFNGRIANRIWQEFNFSVVCYDVWSAK